MSSLPVDFLQLGRVYQLSLQGKDPLAEVIKEVFSVIKLAKIVKKTYATTSVSGNEGFGGAFNGNSTQIKKNGRPKVITDVFFHRCATLHLTHRCVHVKVVPGRSKENAPGR